MKEASKQMVEIPSPAFHIAGEKSLTIRYTLTWCESFPIAIGLLKCLRENSNDFNQSNSVVKHGCLLISIVQWIECMTTNHKIQVRLLVEVLIINI